MTAKQIARFWSKGIPEGACLIWSGYRTEKGYGKVNVRGVAMRAHRVAFELTNGAIPDGGQIDHRCHNPACIAPRHLRLTTQKQNQENRRGPVRSNRSGVRGVRAHSGRWIASVGHNGRQLYLGMFATVAEAEAVVIAKRRELFTHNDRDRQAAA
jgi:hypothetical protein